MCLELQPIKTKQFIANAIKKNKPITAWKLVYRRDGRFDSLFNNYEWKKGINRSTRDSISLTKEEEESLSVDMGFHCFLSFKRAKYELSLEPDCVLIEVEINPKDIVAVGTWDGLKRCPCIVATQANFTKVLKE